MNTINYQSLMLLSNGLIRLFANFVKGFGYLFHAIFPQKRFTIPKFSAAKLRPFQDNKIPNLIWQTNYSNAVTLPVYCNYLFNRLLSLNYDYCYVSTEERAEFIQKHGDQRTYNAYCKLNDGAAQADFWRLFVLYQKGGVYMDIDGHLVWNLSSIIHAQDNEVLIKRRDNYTNFFLASTEGNDFLKETLDLIIENIEQRRVENGVFSLTGPTTLIKVLADKSVNSRLDKITCAQGSFTNEYFQYMDKKKGKWIHAKNEDLLK